MNAQALIDLYQAEENDKAQATKEALDRTFAQWQKAVQPFIEEYSGVFDFGEPFHEGATFYLPVTVLEDVYGWLKSEGWSTPILYLYLPALNEDGSPRSTNAHAFYEQRLVLSWQRDERPDWKYTLQLPAPDVLGELLAKMNASLAPWHKRGDEVRATYDIRQLRFAQSAIANAYSH